MKIKFLCLAGAWFVLSAALSQERSFETRKARLGEIEMEYADFGGDGTPLIWVQDLHNYLRAPEEAQMFLDLFGKLSESFRVVAPIRRGYGNSTATEWGYDVATQAHDLLRFMDALGIQRAILFGAIPATQDMLYLAEHHPERVGGMVFNGGQLVYASTQDPRVLEFLGYFYEGACDLNGRGMQLVGPRLAYRPDFLGDSTRQIGVPLLVFRVPGFDERNIYLNWLDNIQMMAMHHFCGNEEAQTYFKNLATDSLAREGLRSLLSETDLSPRLWDGLQRAFGDRLTLVDMDTSGNFVAQAVARITEFGTKVASD